MQFRKDVEVYSSDDKKVGHVDRVAMDPKTREVTDLIVRKGVLLTKDRVVPIKLVSTTTDKRVNLTINSKEVDSLAEFEAQVYVPLEDGELPADAIAYPNFYWSPTMPNMAAAPIVDPMPGYKLETERNIGDTNVALKAGARVVGSDGEDVGHIAEVFTQSSSDQMTSIVVSRGLLVKEFRLVPMNWVKIVSDDEVQLNVPAAKVDALQVFEPAHH